MCHQHIIHETLNFGIDVPHNSEFFKLVFVFKISINPKITGSNHHTKVLVHIKRYT